MEILKQIGGNVAKLIDLKSIITIVMICTLCYMTITGSVEPAVFVSICTMVVQFYFSKKTDTKGGDQE